MTTRPNYELIFNASPAPTLCVDRAGRVIDANPAAEQFLAASAAALRGASFETYAPPGSRTAALIDQARAQLIALRDYDVAFRPPDAPVRQVDLLAAPLTDDDEARYDGAVLLVVQPRSVAERIDRSLAHRGAARSMQAMAAMLAHEIRNPLAAIAGAAQLFEMSQETEDQELARLILEETDRIKRLVDRFEFFSDSRPVLRRPVNIHDVLNHTRRVAEAGFGEGVRFVERYDPSLPATPGDRDQLIQAFLNLIKNAVEAAGPRGQVTLTTAFRPGVRVATGAGVRESLPLEISVSDDGPGVPPELGAQIFEPFVSAKAGGTGLGLPLVAKVIADHGGVVDLDMGAEGACFRVLLPVWSGAEEDE